MGLVCCVGAVRLIFPAMSSVGTVLVVALHQGLVVSVCRMKVASGGCLSCDPDLLDEVLSLHGTVRQ